VLNRNLPGMEKCSGTVGFHYRHVFLFVPKRDVRLWNGGRYVVGNTVFSNTAGFYLRKNNQALLYGHTFYHQKLIWVPIKVLTTSWDLLHLCNEPKNFKYKLTAVNFIFTDAACL
jgi:parallel beta-helix repeat protein